MLCSLFFVLSELFYLRYACSFLFDFMTVGFWLFSMVSFGMEDFAKKYGELKPSQFVDVIALIGDSADNIPGYFCDSLL